MSKLVFLRLLPFFVRDFLITIYSFYSYRLRQGGRYRELKIYYKKNFSLEINEWQSLQAQKLSSFLQFAVEHSPWFSGIDPSDLKNFPVLKKEDIIKNLNEIKTLPDGKGHASLTGGTTGASMKVIYTFEDSHDRHALLDAFRFKYGHELGKKTAWFSGKNFATEKDVQKGRCYLDDKINKIRFFSTFHINEKNFESYWNALVSFKPEFIVGFPSSVFEICEIALRKGLKLDRPVKVFFPTAEVVLDVHREVIGAVLGCRLVDQYASSEGAPFILECSAGRMHQHPLSGIFEVVDDDLQPAKEGQLLVTSFTTHGTPLIRYQIGDRIKLYDEDFLCECGSSFPLVERIDGRTTDYVFSPEHGKVNLGNLSNATKDTKGIVCFQIEQNFIDSVDLRIVALDDFDSVQQDKFIASLRERLGNLMAINLMLVDEIPKEKSGKFRIVKNNIHHTYKTEAE